MKSKILAFTILISSVYTLYSQTTPVEIVKLSKLTFTNSPTIKRNLLAIDNAKGSFQIQKSNFDYQFISGVSLNQNTSNLFSADPRTEFVNGTLKTNNTKVSTALQKKFRSGLSTNLSVDYALTNDNFPFNRFSQNVGSNINDHSVSSTFSLNQPLLRGRGKTITTALEKASSLQVESIKEQAKYLNSYELYQTGLAYWQYVAAYKSLEIFKSNESRVARVLKITQELVKADKKPAGDLAQIQADLANQERQTNIAKQTLFSAKLNLGRVIGLNEVESRKIGNPLDEFPTILESQYSKDININKWYRLAQENRDDIKSSKKIEEAINLKLKLANNDRKPQLDLTGFVNYGGMNMGNGIDNAFATFYRNEGRSFGYGLGLNFTLPINNNLAKGVYLQNKTALKDQELSNKNLQRNINLNVSIALDKLDNSVIVLEKAQESLNFYKEVYNNEQIKFKNGLTILLNLMQFQERLTYAQLEYLKAHQQFASAIINLRYETGTLLLSNTNTEDAIKKELFYTIPNIN